MKASWIKWCFLFSVSCLFAYCLCCFVWTEIFPYFHFSKCFCVFTFYSNTNMSWVLPYFFSARWCFLFWRFLIKTPELRDVFGNFVWNSTHYLFLSFNTFSFPSILKAPNLYWYLYKFGICRLFSSLEHFFFRLNFESSQTIFDAFSSPNFDSHQSYLHWCVLNKILWATLLSLWIIRHSCWTKFLQFVFHLTKYNVAECQWDSFPMFCHLPLSCWQPAQPKTSNCENDWASTKFFGGDNADV